MKRTQHDAEAGPSKKKQGVFLETFEKWKLNFNAQHSSATWLDCTTSVVSGRKYATSLKCTICTKYSMHISSLRNYSDKWIVGADAFQTSNIVDHANSKQHSTANGDPDT